MNRLTRYGVAAVLFLGLAGRAQSPTLRHTNTLAVQPLAKASAEIVIGCRSHGTLYQDALRCCLIGTADGSVASAQARPGETLRLAVPGGDRRLAVAVRSGWNLADLASAGGLPWALVASVGQPLQTVREWGPLHFFVPAATATLTLWVHADVAREAVHIRVAAADGTVVLDREEDADARTKLTMDVPPSQAGKAWSVSLLKCGTKGWHTDDVALELGPETPGLLSPQPEWAVQFGRDWRRAPSGARASSKLAARPATRPPYRPPPPGLLAQAYERRAGSAWCTSLPLTYVLDYGSAHLGQPDYVPTVATAPPTLLHLGKDLALNHGWGPVRSLGGENQAYGHGDAIARLSPHEVEARLVALQEMVAALHAAGVRYVTPYICGMTLNGDPAKRSGFWEFYDHWDEYRALGLASRPLQDPKEWLQTSAAGAPRLYYAYDPAAGFYPPYKTNHRYAACWRTEGWRTWLLEVVRFVARSGCDGVFVDNGCSQKSCSSTALVAFRAHLKERYTPTQAKALLGIPDLDAAAFPNEREDSLAASELRRFWCRTLRDQMAAIKEAGSAALGREFLVFPNGGHPAELQEGLRDADFVMFEKSIGEYGTNPGLVLQPLLDGVTLRVVNDNLFELLFVRSLHERVRPMILTRPGYPQARPRWVMNPDAARLGMAETAAFSGGGGFLVRDQFNLFHDALNDTREFIEGHPDLYAGLLPWADVAVLALPEQGWLGNRAHLAQVERLTPLLAEARVRFDFVPERRLGAQPWAEARAVVACRVAVLAEAHLLALARYVADGGTLLVSGVFADQDEFLRPRAELPPALGALRGLADGQTAVAGRGRLVRAESDEAVAAALRDLGLRLRCGDHGPAAGVRVAAYRSVAGQRLVVHLVNYHVPLGTTPAPVEEVRDLSLDIPLAPGTSLAGFRVLSPDLPAPVAAEITVSAGVAHLRLPNLRIYAVAELQIR